MAHYYEYAELTKVNDTFKFESAENKHTFPSDLDVVDFLNYLGKCGWKLVTVTSGTYYLVREQEHSLN